MNICGWSGSNDDVCCGSKPDARLHTGHTEAEKDLKPERAREIHAIHARLTTCYRSLVLLGAALDRPGVASCGRLVRTRQD
jgi:hypothetical protein